MDNDSLFSAAGVSQIPYDLLMVMDYLPIQPSSIPWEHIFVQCRNQYQEMKSHQPGSYGGPIAPQVLIETRTT